MKTGSGISLLRRACVGIALALCTMFTATAHAALDSKGTEFWLMFPGNYQGQVDKTLFITSGVNTSGVVTVPGLGFNQAFVVTANTVTSVVLPSNVDTQSSDLVQNLGIRVTALDEVTVYGLSRQQYTTDAFLGLPLDVLGKEYIVLGYKNVGNGQGTQFGLVGTANGTTVTITPSVTTGPRVAGVPYNIVLNQGQTYMLRNTGASPSDLSGSIVTSTEPIGVFGGHQCANIPPGFVACDFIVEQLPPAETWGKEFVTVPLATRLNGDTFRFLAQVNGTTVKVNGIPVATLNRGQLHEQILSGSKVVSADQPILVAQYSNGTSFDGVTSDPFMMLVPPAEQYLDGYTVTTPASGFVTNFINITAPQSAVGLIAVDGTTIPAGNWASIGSIGPKEYFGVQVPVVLGSHRVTSSLPIGFGVFVYGFDDYDSYGYLGGMSFAPVAEVEAVELAPKDATNQVNTQHCVVATVLDQDGNPLENILVVFTVTGANPTPGLVPTNAAGEAQFCYTGVTAGVDSIVASVGQISDGARKTWIDNRDPVCGQAVASRAVIWPPNHKFQAISIEGVTDPDGDPVTITVIGIQQDEPTNTRGDGNTCPDAQILNGQASVRAERSGTPGLPGNGRVYVIRFRAEDGRGGSCTGEVTVCVPHDQGNPTCVDDLRRYDSLGPCTGGNELRPETIADYGLQVGTDGSGAAQVHFELPNEGPVGISVFDVSGRRLATLENGWLPMGVYDRVWDLRSVPNGLYFVRMRAGDVTITRRVLKAR